ncbi:hypothetical protein PMIN05_004435 [Paraphaeosphaeria minitans]
MAVSAPLTNGTTPLGAEDGANGDANAAGKAAHPPARNVRNVVLGSLAIEPWFSSEGYPEEMVGKEVDRLYVCQWCFKYTKERVPFLQHMTACPARTSPPPGTRIYTRGTISIHELDGASATLYAQNLSLFAKFFLHAKSVFYDVSAFLFYLLVLDPADPSIPSALDPATATATAAPSHTQAQVVGFFSKEKTSWDNNNLACICVFPPWQRQGLAQVLIATSYVLGRKDGRTGGPEKPLSAHGYAAYVQYWSRTLARSILRWRGKALTVAELHAQTGIAADDVQNTLGAMGLLERRKRAWVVNRGRARAWVELGGGRVESPVDEEAFVVGDGEGSEEEDEVNSGE